jgi:pimeloyl-ACP methyl ester carboxylesterase
LSFENAGATLSGTLYTPSGDGPFPCVVMVHGSGEQGRFLWSYRSNAYGSLRRGIAVLLYDKRGSGQSQGSGAASLETLAKDALAAREACLAQPGIDRKLVGLYGISQGGWICATAYRLNHDLPFIVINEGPAVSVFDQDLHRVEYSMRAEGFSESAIDSAVDYTKLYFESVLDPDKWPKLQEAQVAVALAEWKGFVNRPATYGDSDMVWWREWNYDPASDLAAISCPVICAFGADDPNVPPDKNARRMDSLLNVAGCEHEVVVIPGLAHATATYQTLLGGEWEWPNAFWVWSRRPAEIDSRVGDFIHNVAHKR